MNLRALQNINFPDPGVGQAAVLLGYQKHNYYERKERNDKVYFSVRTS